MTAGDKGAYIVVDAGGYNMTGCTAQLLAGPGLITNQLGPSITLSPMTIAGNGLTATYETTGTDFLQGGPWWFQLEVTTADGRVFASPLGQEYINPRLPAIA